MHVHTGPYGVRYVFDLTYQGNFNIKTLLTSNALPKDMFQPTQLVTSIQGIFNKIGIVDGSDEQAVKHVPSNLIADVREGKNPVRSYE